MVLQSISVLFGSVNANQQHYELAAEALDPRRYRLAGRPRARHVPLGERVDA